MLRTIWRCYRLSMHTCADCIRSSAFQGSSWGLQSAWGLASQLFPPATKPLFLTKIELESTKGTIQGGFILRNVYQNAYMSAGAVSGICCVGTINCQPKMEQQLYMQTWCKGPYLCSTQTSNMPVIDLPVESLREIFSQLPQIQDLLACELVCSLFQGIIKSSTSLEYRIELARAGMIDNPQCNLTTLTRLELLRQRERTWAEFDWALRVPNIAVPSTLSERHIVTQILAMLGVIGLDSAPGMRGRLRKADWRSSESFRASWRASLTLVMN